LGYETGEVSGKIISSAAANGNFSHDFLAEYGRQVTLLPAIGYVNMLRKVKNVVIPRLSSHGPVTSNELTAMLQAFSIIQNSGW